MAWLACVNCRKALNVRKMTIWSRFHWPERWGCIYCKFARDMRTIEREEVQDGEKRGLSHEGLKEEWKSRERVMRLSVCIYCQMRGGLGKGGFCKLLSGNEYANQVPGCGCTHFKDNHITVSVYQPTVTTSVVGGKSKVHLGYNTLTWWEEKPFPEKYHPHTKETE